MSASPRSSARSSTGCCCAPTSTAPRTRSSGSPAASARCRGARSPGSGSVVAVGLPLLTVVTRQLGVLGLGDDLAAGLGVRAHRLRILITALVVLLTASATAVCGPIAFVGFLSGPIARRLTRGRTSVPAAALVGAAMVLAADYVSAYAVPGTAYPVGVVTGLAGAPVLVWLLVAGRRTIQRVKHVVTLSATLTAESATLTPAEALTLAYDKRVVVEGLDLVVPPGQVTAVVGPNGCGKSTLLRGLSRLLPPSGGVSSSTARSSASCPPRRSPSGSACSRSSRSCPRASPSPSWSSAAATRTTASSSSGPARTSRSSPRALEMTELVHLAGVPVDSLSGGQRQRAWIAMALAQRTPVLLLDEPTSFLDIAHQIDVLELVRDLNASEGTTVVMVLHDLAMAARYADHLVAMCDGAIVAEGTPAQIVTPEVIESVFGIAASVVADPTTGDPVVIPHRRKREKS